MEGQLSFFETKSQVKKYSKTVSVDRIPVGKKLKVISLFSGCGGMDLGFRGGFSVFGRNFDRNPFAVLVLYKSRYYQNISIQYLYIVLYTVLH